MKYVEEYLNDVIKVKPLGKLTTTDDELNGMSGEMVYIDGKCSDIFISHADYANWLEKHGEQKKNIEDVIKHVDKNEFTPFEYSLINFVVACNTEDMTIKGIHCYAKTSMEAAKKEVEQLKEEQKPTNKSETEFMVGDWIVNKFTLFIGQITDIENNICYLKDCNGDEGYESLEDLNNDYRYWTIQDAKDGDVLAEDSCLFIIKKLGHNHSAKIYCCLHDDGFFDVTSALVFDDTSIYPATKEQCDLLFQKIKEAGYEWDVVNKKLKKIEQKPVEWSEEVEKTIHLACEFIRHRASKNGSINGIDYSDLVDRLKNIKPHWRPSDEQMKALAQATVPDDCLEAYETLWDDLYNLKETTK